MSRFELRFLLCQISRKNIVLLSQCVAEEVKNIVRVPTLCAVRICICGFAVRRKGEFPSYYIS